MDKKLPVYTAIAASGVAIIMLAAISIIEIETTEVIATSENASNARDGPFTGVQVDEAVVLHLDNAEAQVMQGNTTGAILELIEAVRLEHGAIEFGTEGSVP